MGCRNKFGFGFFVPVKLLQPQRFLFGKQDKAGQMTPASYGDIANSRVPDMIGTEYQWRCIAVFIQMRATAAAVFRQAQGAVFGNIPVAAPGTSPFHARIDAIDIPVSKRLRPIAPNVQTRGARFFPVCPGAKHFP